MPKPHALAVASRPPERMDDFQAQRRLDEIVSVLYRAKLEFLNRVEELAEEAMGLAVVERTNGQQTDAEVLQYDARQLIRQGIEQANTGLDAARTGIKMAGRMRRMARRAGQ